ncbi:uncharacterized protein LOC106131494 [Amyelois transitella]|uniref:uncharacterized protein LOC106131494 n=1 Tax=Amyelois transitella TaxID=680683 RepID=UPI00067E3729|nr:uncharacterized protein LOC106131494 [Amyelois transitella]
MAKNRKKNKVKVQQQPATKPDLSSEIEKMINSSVAAISAKTVPPVLMKVCRLCGGKEGPFLNIFDQDQMTAIKIDQLMPFRIDENDTLPHKICFRCSAKLEELHEFVNKCIKTQENLHNTMGKKPPVIAKVNTRQMWEEKLNKSNMTNDDICNALIMKAMEGIKDIKDIPRSPTPEEIEPVVTPKKETKVNKPGPLSKKEIKRIEEDNNVQIKDIKLTLDKCDDMARRTTRKVVEEPQESQPDKKIRPSRQATKLVVKDSSSSDEEIIVQEDHKDNKKITNLSFDYDEGPFDSKKNKVEETVQKVETESTPKPFNIMDHICMIKVNGVGVLFQCKLCNRNFLKKEVVQSHSCAKNGIPKVDLTKNIPPREPPKIATVKYINTKVDEAKKVAIKEEPVKTVEVKPPEVKPKPRIGPASRVKHNNSDTVLKDLNNSSQITPIPQQTLSTRLESPLQVTNTSSVVPTINFPSMPALNGRFRLVPGPNNTFTLLEDASANNLPVGPVNFTTNYVPPQISNIVPSNTNIVPTTTNNVDTKISRKRKSNNPPVEQNSHSLLKATEKSIENRSIISLVDNTGESSDISVLSRNSGPKSGLPHTSLPPPTNNTANNQPYPVGLFQTVSRASEPPAFTTPAMKKQSYTVVQTGNPSKLLISTKPQVPVDEVSKKRHKKSKPLKTPDEVEQPFNVTIEDASQPKDRGFFTFINVDPLLQPSYVLPTDNIIQESQISTSTTSNQSADVGRDKEKYSCNMCNETFSREKKLLAHIQSHYTKMDEEDQLRAEKSVLRKRSKKS